MRMRFGGPGGRTATHLAPSAKGLLLMNRYGRYMPAATIAALVAFSFSPFVQAEVLSVSGEAQVRTTQFLGLLPLQTDFGQEIVPTTKPQLPAVGRARLDRLFSSAEVTSSAQGVAIVYEPNVSGQGNPSDVGIDIGAFTDQADTTTSWIAMTTARAKRTLRFSAAEVGVTPGITEGRARGRLLLSGVIILASENPTADLSGAEVSFVFQLDRVQSGRPKLTPVSGEIALVGGPNGTTSVERRNGVLAGVSLPVFDLNAAIPEVALVKAVSFPGIEFQYEYDMTVDSPFDLELIVSAKVINKPGGIGGLAVFGTPQESLSAIFSRVKQDDSGERLAAAINKEVDTTGQAYLATHNAAANFIPACGAAGASAVPMMALGLTGFIAGHRRVRRAVRLR